MNKVIFVLVALVLISTVLIQDVPVMADGGISKENWFYLRNQKVFDITCKKFDKLSIDDIVRQAWFELMGEDLSGPSVMVMSLDDREYFNLLGMLTDPNHTSMAVKMFYYPVMPSWPLDIRVSTVMIYYRKNSLYLFDAISALSHEYAHASKCFNDPYYVGRPYYPYQMQEDIANAGMLAIARYLEERDGFPMVSYPEFFDWANRIGPWEKNEIISNTPSSKELALFFKTFRGHAK